MEQLKTALSFGGILSAEDVDYAADFFKLYTFKPGEEFLSIGKISKKIGFVNLHITPQSLSRIRREMS